MRQVDEERFITAGLKWLDETSGSREAIAALVRAAAASIGSDMGSFYLLHGDVLRPFITHNFPPAYAEVCKEVRLGKQCCGRAALHKMAWSISDVSVYPEFNIPTKNVNSGGIRSVLSVPVLDGQGKCIGTLAAHFTSHYEPTKIDIERLYVFAKLIAYAIARHGIDKARAAVTP